MNTILLDLRHAIRMIRLNPLFSFTVALTLALGIGATTAIFSVVDGVVIKPLPYPDSNAVVTVAHTVLFGKVRTGFRFSPQMLATYVKNGRAFKELGIYRFGQAAITGMGIPERANTLLVTGGTLRALNVQPALGRWFSHDDNQPGAAETAILSNSYWQARFGGDPGVIGHTITVDSKPCKVIGVMPRGFTFRGFPIDLILPLHIDLARAPGDFNYAAVGRLKPGVTVAEANADVARMIPIYVRKYGAGHHMDALHLKPAVRPLKEDVVGNVGQVLWVLLGSISILLVIACANVANLMLVRTEARGAELALRTALGAGSGRLARGLIVESLTLSFIGGSIGVGLAYGGLQVLRAFPPTNLPRLTEIGIDLPVLGFAAGLSILSGLLFGLVSMWRLARGKTSSHLAEFVRGGERDAGAGKHQHRSQNTLVVVQVALALVMLVSSGLMIRTFENMRDVQPGFTDPATIQTVSIAMPGAMSKEPQRLMRTEEQILERLQAVPGVRSAGYISRLPMEGGPNAIVAPEGETYPKGELPPLRRIKWISPGLLQTLGTPLLAGRDFDWAELHNQRNVALVSKSYALQTWNTVEGALGKRIRIGTDGPWQKVVGVVADIYDDGTNKPPPPTVYWPARKHPFVAGNYVPLSVAFALRTDRAGTQSLATDIRHAVSAVAPNLPVAQVRTLADIYAASMARTSFSLVLLGIAGVMGLLLGVVGIYGVLTYAVMQRRREVGIRLAVGASPRTVKRIFIYRGMILSGLGIAVGAAVAVGSTRLMSSLLFGVTPLDAVTFVAGAGVLAVTAFLASYISARGAAAVDPAETLRGQ